MWQEQAKILIKEFEDLILTPYPCPSGYPTIGYGHLIKNTENFNKGISLSEAEFILDADIIIANQAITRLIRVPLNNNQRAALIVFVFNVGAGAFQASTLRQKLNRGEYNDAADQFQRWVYGVGRILPGLVRRRHVERALFLMKEVANSNRPPAPLSTPFWKEAA